MFFKVKLEPQSSKALSPLKNTTYFCIDDDATIITLKLKIEEFVNYPAERQEIRNLTKTFQNNSRVKDVCDVKGSCSIMLYAFDDFHDYEDPHFVCFLQVYTNEMAAKQQEFEQRLKQLRTKAKTSNSSSSSGTLIQVSDTDNSELTDTETASSKSSGSETESSGSSSDNSDSSGGKKRSKHGKQSTQHKKLKVTGSVGGQCSPTLCDYLEEFPKCSKQQINCKNNEVVEKTQPVAKKIDEIKSNDPTTSNSALNNSFETMQKTNTNTDSETDATITNSNISSNLNKIQSNAISTTNNKNNIIHPCYSINPEIREYVVIISKVDKTDISTNECKELLVWFFDRFRSSDSSSNLQFYNQNAVTLYEGKLWIACMDKITFEWMSESISEYADNSYTISSLKESSHLCEVVLPIVSNGKQILDIFDLLEKQNKNLSTLKWSIRSRKMLLPEVKNFNEKAISTFCTNEIFHIVMDKESKEYLEKLNFKLKYCFWQIVFQVVNNN